jgi:hypothetical protein
MLATLVLLLLGISTPAFATAITKQAANQYFTNCQSQPSPGMSDQTKQYMCACTAAKMQENMTVEDVKTMAQQSQAGRNATNKMIIKVYAPCIEYPARDHYYTTCMTNPQTKNMTKNPQGMCACLGTQVSNYLKQNAQKEFARILSRTPNVTDPMAALTNDPAFTKFAQSKLLGCVR